MGKTRKRKQRGGVDLTKTIEKVQRMDVQIDAMTQKINGLKLLLQEPMVPIPESAFRAPAPSPSVAAVPPHLRGKLTPAQPPPVPEATAPKHSPLTRQGAFKEKREANVPLAQPPPPRPLVRQGALKEIPGVVRANSAPEGTVKALTAQIEAKKPMPPPPVPLARQGALRSIPGVPKPRHVTFTNRNQVSGVNQWNGNRNRETSRNLQQSRKSIQGEKRRTLYLNPQQSQIYAQLSANYNTPDEMVKALQSRTNLNERTKRNIEAKLRLNFEEL